VTYPVMLDGSRFKALVVGGGSVAVRKAMGLLEGGVPVTIVAPVLCEEVEQLWSRFADLSVLQRVYESTDAEGATIVIAATNDAGVNRRVADDGRARGALVNVVDNPKAGNFVTPSVHRSGDLAIAVSTGRTPAVAAAIRSELGRRFDARYDSAIGALRALRDRLLGEGRRDEWKRASRELIADDFCENVEQGRVEGQVRSWR
jgi:precorrin-2 dehydrogenase/sirohydrochlorin ferrochelatase